MSADEIGEVSLLGLLWFGALNPALEIDTGRFIGLKFQLLR
jgi:hypothetical protein